MVRQGNRAEAKQHTKSIQQIVRKARRKDIRDSVSKNLNEKNLWMGIRRLKEGFKPLTFALKDPEANGRRTKGKATLAASFLANTLWGKPNTEDINREPVQDKGKIIKTKLNINEYEITIK